MLKLPQEIEEAIAREGLRPTAVTPVSRQSDPGGRIAYRVQREAGGSVKLRRLENEAVARELCAVRAPLEKAFTRVLARHGRVLVEEWAEGRELDALGADEPLDRSREAGGLLGRLHATPVRAELPAPSYDWLEQGREELERLAREEVLPPAKVAALQDELGAYNCNCRAARVVLVHRDYCGENMLIDESGALRVFDNERFSLEPAGFDLGRTHSRWPMTDTHWRSFCEGYRQEAPGDPGPVRFWQVVVALWSLRLRREREPDRVQAPLEALGRLL